MITSKKTDGTYGEIGFIKARQDDGSYKDIEYQYDNKGNLIFEKGFTRSKEGVLPLVINGIGKPLKDYSIYGNIYQSDGVSPDTPQEVVGCGDFDESTGKYKLDVVSKGKNQANISAENWKLQNADTTVDVVDNRITINGVWFAYIIVPVTANTNYAFQYVCESYTKKNLAAIFGVKNDVMNSSDPIVSNAPSGKTFNSGERTEVALLFYASDSSETGVSIYSNIQLELGSTATEYSPYVEPITTPIYLDSPLYKIGDYADRRGSKEEVRAVKELVLTGEENWALQSINEYGIANFFIKLTDAHKITIKLICTHFIEQTTQIANTMTEGVFDANGNALYIRVNQERMNTATAFKSYLAEQYEAGTPVKVYYVLATPEVTEVDAVEIPTLNGTTVIDADTEVKPSNMYVKYKSSI